MTNPLTCPECQGTGEDRSIPKYVLKCMCCYGRGVVGDPDDPAANPRPALTTPLPAWLHPALEGTGLCGYCVGSGLVAHVNKETRRLTETPCPACAPAPPPIAF
jgi:hypothetical protein